MFCVVLCVWRLVLVDSIKPLFCFCDEMNCDGHELSNGSTKISRHSVDQIVICWLSITETLLKKPSHPVGVDCRNVM
jgi:hypothetical protein